MPTLGAFVRRRRIELGLTQEALADLVGDKTRQADISRLENDRVKLPRRGRLNALANALEISPGELLARSGWTGGEAIDRSVEDNGLASQVEELRDELQIDEGEVASSRVAAIEDALPAISETVAQMHDLVHEAENILDQTLEMVDDLKKSKTTD